MANILETLAGRLSINEHALDIALREHPDLFYTVATELALAISNRDEAKMEVDEVEAKVASEIRHRASVDDEKVTDKSVSDQVKLDKRVQAANTKFIEERLNAAKWTALKEAYESRSYAISKLVDLYLANYYSTIEKKNDTDYRTVRSQQIKDHNREARNPRAPRVTP